MRKLNLSAGHSVTIWDGFGKPALHQADRGIIVNNPVQRQLVEGDLNARLRRFISLQLDYLGVEYTLDHDESVLRDSIAFFRKLVKPEDIAIEIHFNGGGGHGAEVIIPENPSKYERKWGERMSKLIAETLQIRDRGCKCEKTLGRRLGWMRVPCENFLPEICFLDNPKDVEQYFKFKTVLVLKLADLFKEMREDI